MKACEVLTLIGTLSQTAGLTERVCLSNRLSVRTLCSGVHLFRNGAEFLVSGLFFS